MNRLRLSSPARVLFYVAAASQGGSRSSQ